MNRQATHWERMFAKCILTKTGIYDISRTSTTQ